MAGRNKESEGVKTATTEALANPAVVGLGAFGGTTLLLQIHNLGIAGSGVVMWMAFFFGGLTQLIAGFKEFQTGNNFGFAAFTTYGAFWIALGGIFLSMNLGLFDISSTDVGWFLVVFTILTLIYFIGSMKQNSALAIVFITLLAGFVLLDIHFLGGVAACLDAAGVELIVCAASAWYLMAHVLLSPLGIRIPIGKPWIR
jgi:succinate-acetate transporter protein